jgi:hypothetical protein
MVTYAHFLEEFFRLQLFAGLAHLSDQFATFNARRRDGKVDKLELAAVLGREFGADYFTDETLTSIFNSISRGKETFQQQDLFRWCAYRTFSFALVNALLLSSPRRLLTHTLNSDA